MLVGVAATTGGRAGGMAHCEAFGFKADGCEGEDGSRMILAPRSHQRVSVREQQIFPIDPRLILEDTFNTSALFSQYLRYRLF